MIREYPQVPAAVELADLARYIYRHEFTFPDPAYNNSWVWQGPEEFDPLLKIVVHRQSLIVRSGSFIVRHAVFVQVDGSNEYEVGIPVIGAGNIKDDAYIKDFVAGYRQYPFGRSRLEPDFEQLKQPGINN